MISNKAWHAATHKATFHSHRARTKLAAFIFTDHARLNHPSKIIRYPYTTNRVAVPLSCISDDLAATVGKPHVGNKQGDFNSLGRDPSSSQFDECSLLNLRTYMGDLIFLRLSRNTLWKGERTFAPLPTSFCVFMLAECSVLAPSLKSTS